MTKAKWTRPEIKTVEKNKRAHASGPWSWGPRSDRGTTQLLDGYGLAILEIHESHGEGWLPDDAEARLIVAAPDLLIALLDLIENHRRVANGEAIHVPARILHAAEFAVARALGATRRLQASGLAKMAEGGYDYETRLKAWNQWRENVAEVALAKARGGK